MSSPNKCSPAITTSAWGATVGTSRGLGDTLRSETGGGENAKGAGEQESANSCRLGSAPTMLAGTVSATVVRGGSSGASITIPQLCADSFFLPVNTWLHRRHLHAIAIFSSYDKHYTFHQFKPYINKYTCTSANSLICRIRLLRC